MFFEFFSISVALAQNTTRFTTATTMAATGGNGPLAPHMRPCAPRQHIKWMGDNPPILQMYFEGGLRMWIALKVLLCSGNDALPHHLSVLRAIHTPNSPKNYICFLGGCWTSIQCKWLECKASCGGLGLPVVAMVGYGCVGQCWRLEADVRSTYCRNSNNFLQKIFFYSYVDLIHSWHLTWQLKKEDLDLCTFDNTTALISIVIGLGTKG